MIFSIFCILLLPDIKLVLFLARKYVQIRVYSFPFDIPVFVFLRSFSLVFLHLPPFIIDFLVLLFSLPFFFSFYPHIFLACFHSASTTLFGTNRENVLEVYFCFQIYPNNIFIQPFCINFLLFRSLLLQYLSSISHRIAMLKRRMEVNSNEKIRTKLTHSLTKRMQKKKNEWKEKETILWKKLMTFLWNGESAQYSCMRCCYYRFAIAVASSTTAALHCTWKIRSHPRTQNIFSTSCIVWDASAPSSPILPP